MRKGIARILHDVSPVHNEMSLSRQLRYTEYSICTTSQEEGINKSISYNITAFIFIGWISLERLYSLERFIY